MDKGRNEKDLEQLFKRAREIKLDREDREQLRSFLIDFKAPFSEVKVSGKSTGFNIFFGRPVYAFSALLFLVAFGTGISLAAESSSPGDILYPVKLAVNEEIIGLFKFSEGDKARWLIELAERRLKEIENLAARGELNSEIRHKIESNFEAKSKRLERHLDEAEKSDNIILKAQITSRLETSLRAHEEIIAEIADKKSENRSELSETLDKVKSAASSAMEKRRNFEEELREEKNGRLESAIRLRAEAAERAIVRAKEALGEKGGGGIQISASSEAGALIARAEEILLKAKEEIKEGRENEAFEKLHEAFQIAHQTELMLEAEKRLNLDELFRR